MYFQLACQVSDQSDNFSISTATLGTLPSHGKRVHILAWNFVILPHTGKTKICRTFLLNVIFEVNKFSVKVKSSH